MLRSLAITDYTIIDRLELDFGPGFGAITGETGAGKSILIDALGLLLGDRADAGVVADGARRADLSARFELPDDHPAQRWLVEQALDEQGELVLRRMIPAEGASRAWINGQSATVGQLRELGQRLVEIHGQHEHQKLADPVHQRRWLDRGADADLRADVSDRTAEVRETQAVLDRLDAESGSDADLLRFQLEELDRLDLGDDELPTLEAEQRRLASIDDLQRACSLALGALEGDAESTSGALGTTMQATRALEPVADREQEFAEVLEMLGTVRVNLEESIHALTRIGDELEADPERLEAVDRRLGRAMELARKHRREPEDLPAIRKELRERLARIDGAAEAREEAMRGLDQARRNWLTAARALHEERRRVADRLAAEVGRALADLGMEQARLEFSLDFDEQAEVASHGADRIDILFSANPGQSPRSLKRVASGGELSRLSLAMIIASAEPAAGLVRIFDEIDAGVGGETAHKVGEFLHRAGEGGQAFCVTHLAQVAARADQQFRVIKRADADRTEVTVERLDDEARIAELARMLGSERGETSRRHAEALLSGSSAES